jgi:hypothetical protein
MCKFYYTIKARAVQSAKLMPMFSAPLALAYGVKVGLTGLKVELLPARDLQLAVRASPYHNFAVLALNI